MSVTYDLLLDELDNEDLVFTLDKDIANLLYKAWNSSIKVCCSVQCIRELYYMVPSSFHCLKHG